MKARRMALAIAIAAVFSPSAAHAAATCLDQYYRCLNDTWAETGFSKFLADLECGVEYIGCLRAKV